MRHVDAVVEDVEKKDLGYYTEVLLPTTKVMGTTTKKKFKPGDKVKVAINFEQGTITDITYPKELVEEVPEPSIDKTPETQEIIENENDPIDE